MARKEFVKVVWDRKHLAEKRGHGYIEFVVYLSRLQRKFISFGCATEMEWRRIKNSHGIAEQVKKYTSIVEAMHVLGEEMTVKNFEAHLNLETTLKEAKKDEAKMFNGQDLTESFVDFMRDFMENEDVAHGTMKHKKCVLRSIEESGIISKYEDLTVANIMAYDRYLHDGKRTDVTIATYHKYLHYYINILIAEDRIPKDPYKRVKIKKGESEPRQPLTEDELLLVRNVDLSGREKLDRVRDLFIFMAYTGLSYADTQVFDFKKSTVWDEEQGIYYISGKRVKTGVAYYTPMLPPALAVLQKYDYRLPKISNQKANDHLHTIEQMLGIQKPMTCHIARHSFATLSIELGGSMEASSKMLGHTNIKTTQRYAKIMQSKVRLNGGILAAAIR